MPLQWLQGGHAALQNFFLVALQVNESTHKNTKLVKSRKDDKVVMRMKAELDEFKETALPVLIEVGRQEACENRE